jgi:hypothetical protein
MTQETHNLICFCLGSGAGYILGMTIVATFMMLLEKEYKHSPKFFWIVMLVAWGLSIASWASVLWYASLRP